MSDVIYTDQTDAIISAPKAGELLLVDNTATDLLVLDGGPNDLLVYQATPEIHLFATGPSELLVVAVPAEAVILTIGEAGPVGPAGPAGPASASVVTKIATQALGGNRVVISDVGTNADYADNTNITHRDFILGITTGAASAGAVVNVQTSGEMTEPTWNWVRGPVWLGAAGGLTQVTPIAPAAFARLIGIALVPTKINITLREPITLN